MLRYWEDHSVQTVAEMLDITPGAVKMRSMGALATLRVLLGDDEMLPAPQARTLASPQAGAGVIV